MDFSTPVVADPADDRDRRYVADRQAGATRPAAVSPREYQHYVGTTWHQRGQECAGFALAAIANFHLRRHRDDPTLPSVSRRMMYEVAQMYDHESFESGSTLRGALKGWSRTGVALDEQWPYDARDEDGSRHGTLDLARQLDARHRPLLSYSKIDGADIATMQDALVAGYPLYVSSRIHVGWYRLFLPDADPTIVRRSDDADKGGHAFVVAGYDERGFWVHNSWGPEWGTDGYALLSYSEWIERHLDVWVVEVDPNQPATAATASRRQPSRPWTSELPEHEEVDAYRDMWQHLVVVGDDGQLVATGTYEMDDASLATLLFLFQEYTAGWDRRRVAIIADSGALPIATTIERFRRVRDQFLAAEIYPFFVVWETSWLADLEDEFAQWSARLGSDASPLDVLDRSTVGLMWHQIDRRSRAACASPSGAARSLERRVRHKRSQKPFDLHLVGIGAGDLLMAQLARLLPQPITTVTAVASPLPLDDLARSYGSALARGRVHHLSLVVESDIEPSLATSPPTVLQLAAEVRPDIGETASTDSREWPRRLLGRAADVAADPLLRQLRNDPRLDVRTAPTVAHADLFDDDSVLAETINVMLQHRSVDPPTEAPAVSPVNPLPRDPLARAEAIRDARRRRRD